MSQRAVVCSRCSNFAATFEPGPIAKATAEAIVSQHESECNGQAEATVLVDLPLEVEPSLTDSGHMNATTTAPEYVLKASKFASNSFLPPQVSIFSNRIEVRGKVTLGNQESASIGYAQVAGVSIKASAFSKASLTIETTGGARHTIEKVKLEDARRAESLINGHRFA